METLKSHLPVAAAACSSEGDWQRHCDDWAEDLGGRLASLVGCSGDRRGRVTNAGAIRMMIRGYKVDRDRAGARYNFNTRQG